MFINHKLLPCVIALREGTQILYNGRENRFVCSIPLVRTDNLGVHPREMVVDVVFLLVGVALDLLARGWL
jgi:hypothetical protein